ncbi:MAG: DeoR/GlpR transcriptional regulator [Microbacterium sp.]|jgi:DeoR/GlpR family transcriptional regulator of sugar metabolism|uniref:DeoR/GlpR transcriptional regulator n=1 Tax=Microbacterium ginsengisoli TaxID=400772 RepID=A0A0F0LT02_9MICO|nr:MULTISPECIES: DeoR/GlpR family DNA-binding transcription regulator [Microbacterium]MAL06535.1 DeoR/GlpR transcriptional regulator [Microbacterium sp.]MCK9915478.1 DeoR/GlpR family DNA-binding transcription regulator [Microbacteriaceae bacterium K1510]KJL36248.1 Glucitol operon repressor [Microbacterium ginsengisoli]MBN9208258.1 DeoR/GlpR transcriptional regulator [Microbacterium ginsengisoli]HAN25350.1 DeoR/GlpR transcriptional regulator [Microbacterium ginsengisoli]
MASDPPLIPEQRQRELLRLLRGAGALGIRHLADHLGVSHMTVRRDIAALEADGRVVSVQGGVSLTERAGVEPPRERASRALLELPRKQAIAAAAAQLVGDDSVVFLDAGTTCEALVPHIALRRDVTIVTNDFFAVATLRGYPSIQTIHTGGAVDAASGSATGPLAAATLGALAIDVAFLSTGAWDRAHGVTTPELDKLTLKRAAMDAASVCVLVADSTKYGASERFKVAPLDAFDVVVTDDGLDEIAAADLRDRGVDLRSVHAAG